MKAPATATIETQEASPEANPYRVLLASPKSLTIPIFALQAEAGRPSREVWSLSIKDEGSLLDKQASGHLRKGTFGEHRFVTTRHKQGLRTASYATWLAFADEEKAKAFVADHPRYGLENMLSAAVRRRETIGRELENGLARGRYELGELDNETRYHRAKLYVTSTDEVRRLSVTAGKLERLREHLAGWLQGCSIG